jgi:hypothetical protein
LQPAYPDYDLQLTKAVKVYKRKSFEEISKETGYSLEIIKKLNPSYKKEIIPPTAEGSYLILPKISSINSANQCLVNTKRLFQQ